MRFRGDKVGSTSTWAEHIPLANAIVAPHEPIGHLNARYIHEYPVHL
jgi:hypothetical protein